MRELTDLDKAEIVDAIPEANLVLFLASLQGRGGQWLDRSVNANHGTIFGASWAGTARRLKCLSFDGLNDYVRVPNHASLNIVGAITVEMWLQPNLPFAWLRFLQKGNNVDSGVTAFRFIDWGGIGVLHFTVNNAESLGIAYTDGVWQHIVGVYDLANIYLVVDNVWSVGVPYAFPIGVNANDLAVMAQADPVNYQRGSVALVRIYSRALSAAEIARHYARERHIFGV